MSGQETDQEKSKANKSWRLFRRDKADPDEIDEFFIGDLNSTKDVVIGVNGAVAGNVSAQSIRIMGTIFGSVTAPEIVIDQGGQVWGDIFATTLMITVDAKVHGWLSTFDVGTLELIQSGSLSASDVMSLHLSARSEELVELQQSAGIEEEIGNPGSQPQIYRKFQVEGGSAIIARLELEKFYGPGKSSSVDEASNWIEEDGPNSSILKEEVASPGASSVEIRAELSTVLKNLDTTNAELVHLLADLEISTQQIYNLKSERDLYKKRFQKLARWVYQNKG